MCESIGHRPLRGRCPKKDDLFFTTAGYHKKTLPCLPARISHGAHLGELGYI